MSERRASQFGRLCYPSCYPDGRGLKNVQQYQWVYDGRVVRLLQREASSSSPSAAFAGAASMKVHAALARSAAAVDLCGSWRSARPSPPPSVQSQGSAEAGRVVPLLRVPSDLKNGAPPLSRSRPKKNCANFSGEACPRRRVGWACAAHGQRLNVFCGGGLPPGKPGTVLNARSRGRSRTSAGNGCQYTNLGGPSFVSLTVNLAAAPMVARSDSMSEPAWRITSLVAGSYPSARRTRAASRNGWRLERTSMRPSSLAVKFPG
jgi:hypothetical protein